MNFSIFFLRLHSLRLQQRSPSCGSAFNKMFPFMLFFFHCHFISLHFVPRISFTVVNLSMNLKFHFSPRLCEVPAILPGVSCNSLPSAFKVTARYENWPHLSSKHCPLISFIQAAGQLTPPCQGLKNLCLALDGGGCNYGNYWSFFSFFLSVKVPVLALVRLNLYWAKWNANVLPGLGPSVTEEEFHSAFNKSFLKELNLSLTESFEILLFLHDKTVTRTFHRTAIGGENNIWEKLRHLGFFTILLPPPPPFFGMWLYIFITTFRANWRYHREKSQVYIVRNIKLYISRFLNQGHG